MPTLYLCLSAVFVSSFALFRLCYFLQSPARWVSIRLIEYALRHCYSACVIIYPFNVDMVVIHPLVHVVLAVLPGDAKATA